MKCQQQIDLLFIKNLVFVVKVNGMFVLQCSFEL